MIESALDRLVSLLRRTARVVDAVAVTASVVVDRQPASTAVIEVTLAGGTDGTGTVTVSGNYKGSPVSETLTFTGNGSLRTSQRFDTLDPLTTTGLADEATPPTISATARGRDGSWVQQEVALVSGYPAAQRERGDTRLRILRGGEHRLADATWLLAYPGTAYTPQAGDVLVESQDTTRWTVEGWNFLPSSLRPLHLELRCRKSTGPSRS